MSAMTDVFEVAMATLILNGDAWAPTGAPTGNLIWNDAGATVTDSNSKIWIRLYSVDPTDAMDTGTAVTVANGYNHKQVAFEELAASETDGQCTTTAAVTWTATGDWNTTVNGFSLHLADAATDVADGNAMFHGAFGGAVTVQNGDTVNIAIGALTITFA
tara:strand:- start:385 stop:864 length:480 start_codon:yes stop_codon:yes gene_type:complete